MIYKKIITISFLLLIIQKFHCGLNIKKYRRAIGLNQLELGEKIGRTQALISYIEKTGKANEQILIEIAKVLGVSVEELLYEGEEKIHNKMTENLRKDKLYLQLQSEIEYLRKTIDDLKSIIMILSIKHKKKTDPKI